MLIDANKSLCRPNQSVDKYCFCDSWDEGSKYTHQR
jgi:hypothetical protein